MDPRRLAGVLVDPHPTLWVEAPSEPELLAQLAAVGPLPQADVFEPWEPTDPWRARARVPHADPGRCLAVGELHHGDPPGRLEWIDCGRVGEDCLELAGHTARCIFDHEGGLIFPDLVELPQSTERVLAGFAAGIGGAPIWVQAIQHRESGRPGYRFTAQVPDRDPQAERLAVLEAVLGCGEPLCADLLWWFELGRVVFIAWRIHPPLPALPADAGFGWSAPLDGWDGRIELQVPLDPATHEADALALAEQLGPLGFQGSRPRWIGPDFVACWEAPEEPTLPDLTVPHRFVPGCPVGLEEPWLGVDPRWWPGHLVRYRCGLRDRDLLPRCTSRDADPIDHALIALFGGFAQLDPVQADVPALRITFPTLTPRHWALWVERFAQVQHPELAPVHYVAMGESTTVLLRRQGDAMSVAWGPSRDATR